MESKKVDWLVQYDSSGRITKSSFTNLLDKMQFFSIKNVNESYRKNMQYATFPASSDDDILFLEVKNLIQKANANQLVLDDGTQLNLEQLKILLNNKCDDILGPNCN